MLYQQASKLVNTTFYKGFCFGTRNANNIERTCDFLKTLAKLLINFRTMK